MQDYASVVVGQCQRQPDDDSKLVRLAYAPSLACHQLALQHLSCYALESTFAVLNVQLYAAVWSSWAALWTCQDPSLTASAHVVMLLTACNNTLQVVIWRCQVVLSHFNCCRMWCYWTP